jgi:transposase-like protein
MPSTRTRTTRVAHTDKRPERCPHCGSSHVTRKGTRKKKIEIVQLWRCGSCKRVFTPAPAALRNKTYPLHVVLDAITLYNLGYTLPTTVEKIKSRFAACACTRAAAVASRPGRLRCNNALSSIVSNSGRFSDSNVAWMRTVSADCAAARFRSASWMAVSTSTTKSVPRPMEL